MKQAVKIGRVAIFSASMRGGGAERVMSIVANKLAHRGYLVDLLLSQKEGPYLQEIDSNVTIVDFNSSRVLFSLIPLIRYLRSARPDALLSAVNHVNITSVIGCRLARSKTRLVISQRGAPRVSSNGEKATRRSSFLLRTFYPLADVVVTVSAGIKKELVDAFKISSRKVTTINNPLQIEEIKALASEEVTHPWINSKDCPVLLSVGRLNPVKDHETMLVAFKKVRTIQDAKLIILGDGPLKESLIQLATELGVVDDVDFIGFHPNPYAWMAKSDVFLMSSRSEGFPNSLVQAMACGVQVVSTDCEYGPKEILQEGTWGRLVPLGSPQLFAEAIVATLSDPTPPEVQIRAADFAVDKIIDQYIEVLQLGK